MTHRVSTLWMVSGVYAPAIHISILAYTKQRGYIGINPLLNFLTESTGELCTVSDLSQTENPHRLNDKASGVQLALIASSLRSANVVE